MTMHHSLLAAALVAAAGFSLVPATAVAQAAPAANTLGGSAIPGLCMLSREAVFAQSKVGQAASERLKSLAQGQQTQLENQKKTLDADIQAFQQKQASLTEAQRQQQGGALQGRMQAFQGQVHDLEERVDATRGKVMQQIGQQAQPVVEATYNSHHCGLLLNRDAVLGGNTTNDLTPDVIKGLDAKVTTLSFNLEPVSAAAPAAGK
jgi:Skp family chaperone for outer membrane proteins